MEKYLKDKENYLESKIRRSKSNKEKYLLYLEYMNLSSIYKGELGVYIKPKVAVTNKFYEIYQTSGKNFYSEVMQNFEIIREYAKKVKQVYYKTKFSGIPLVQYGNENIDYLYDLVNEFFYLFPNEVNDHIDKIADNGAIIETESKEWGGCCNPFPLESESFVRVSPIFNELYTITSYAHEFGHAWKDTLYNKYGQNHLFYLNILTEYPSTFFELSFINYINSHMVSDKSYYTLNKIILNKFRDQVYNTLKYSGKIMNYNNKRIEDDSYSFSEKIYKMLYFIGTLLAFDTVDMQNPTESFNTMKNIIIKNEYIESKQILESIDINHVTETLEEKIETVKELQRKLYYSTKNNA